MMGTAQNTLQRILEAFSTDDIEETLPRPRQMLEELTTSMAKCQEILAETTERAKEAIRRVTPHLPVMANSNQARLAYENWLATQGVSTNDPRVEIWWGNVSKIAIGVENFSKNASPEQNLELLDAIAEPLLRIVIRRMLLELGFDV